MTLKQITGYNTGLVVHQGYYHCDGFFCEWYKYHGIPQRKGTSISDGTETLENNCQKMEFNNAPIRPKFVALEILKKENKWLILDDWVWQFGEYYFFPVKIFSPSSY